MTYRISFSPWVWMRKASALLVAGAALALAGCASDSSPQQPVRPVARTQPGVGVSTGWTGVYRGTNPACPATAAPGCAGMELMLTLNANNTYSLTTTILRRGKPYSFTSRGRFQRDASGTVITLASKDENTRLRLGNGYVERISSDAMTPEESAREPLVLRKM